jgi:hypothetical protein
MNDWHPNHYRFPRVSNHNDPQWLYRDSERGDKLAFIVSIVLLALLVLGVL